MIEWKLHFLSGSNDGDEVILMDGETIIGTDEITADFVLSHNDMYSEFFGINLNNEKAYLTNLDIIQNLSINDVEISSRENIEISSQDNIYIDGFRFAIIKLGDVLISKDNLKEEFESLEAEDEQIFQKQTIKKKPTIQKNKILLILILTLGFAVVTFVMKFNKDVVEIKKTNIINNKTMIRDKLLKIQKENINIDYNEDFKKYYITGYVNTKHDKKLLIEEINSITKNVLIDINAMDGIVENVKFILENFGLSSSKVIEDNKAGYVIISGINNTEIVEDLEGILQNDIPGLLGWKFDGEKKEDYIGMINSLLSKNDLLNKLKVVSNGEQIDLYGALTLKEKSIFDKINNEFVLKYGDVPRLILKNNTVSKKNIVKKPSVKIDFNVKAVSFNNIPYIILTDNRRYTKGMKIPSGHTISEINDSGVMLTKDKIKTFVKFKGFDG